jgi:thiol-disulfide isomerase/thioredoxin
LSCVLVLAVGVASATELPEGFRLEPVLTGLTEPSGLAATPDGRILITERTTGNLRVVQHGELQAAPLCTVAVNSTGAGGLLGVAVHPDFDLNQWIYLYYTDQGTGLNRVSRFSLAGTCSLSAVILPDLGAGASFLRNGGGLGFGPDGKLYVATGDVEDDANGQDTGNLLGKVLRMEDDGSLPTPPNASGTLVYAIGLRDGRGISFGPAGQVYATDCGDDVSSAHDEANLVAAGGNLGWDDETGPGGIHDEPLVSWLPTVGAVAISSYGGSNFPDLDADGLDSDHDHLGPDHLPGVARFDDNGVGVCIGSTRNDLPCSVVAECAPPRAPAGETTLCEKRDDPAEACAAGSDDDCDSIGATGLDEPDESFLHDLFVTSEDAIHRAALMGAGLDQLSTSSVFLDSTYLASCPTGWTGVMTGRDGFLYALARNSGGATGALYRVIHDETPGPREVSSDTSYFPLRVGKTAQTNRVNLIWEDLRDDALQPRDSGGIPVAPVREYTVWKGTLGSFYSHSPVSGLNATAGTAVNDALRSSLVSVIPEQNDYYLVSARSDNLEGPLGFAVNGEIPGYTETDLCNTIGYHHPGFALWKCGKDFTLTDTHGEAHNLYEYRGSIVLLDFSAIWCPPCVTQANVMEAVYQQYKNQDVKILTLLMDEDEQTIDYAGRPTQAECRNWEDRPGANPNHTFPCWNDPNPTNISWPLYNKWGALPTNVVLDTGLRVVYSAAGYNEAQIKTKFNQLGALNDVCVH